MRFRASEFRVWGSIRPGGLGWMAHVIRMTPNKDDQRSL